MNCGYKKVTLCKNGIKKNARVNQLVGVAFIGPRPNGQVLMHLNGSRVENNINNLVYGSQICNEAFKIDDNTILKGERNHNSKLTWLKVDRIREFLKVNISISSLSKQFSVSRKTIGNIKNNRAWIL